MPSKPRQSGKPGGRRKAVAEVRELARKHTEAAILTLAEIAMNPDTPATARVAAIKELLERGHGKGTQAVEAEIKGILHVEKIERIIVPGPNA